MMMDITLAAEADDHAPENLDDHQLHDWPGREDRACSGTSDKLASVWGGFDGGPSRSGQQGTDSAEMEIRLRQTLERLRNARSVAFDELTPLSWLRFIGSMFSYILLCTDMVRSGLGSRDLNEFASFGPNAVMLFGPWAYPVQSIPKNETNGTANVWTYKFDTTSIIWRAFGEYYDIDAFPRCLMYKEPCPEDTFSFVNLFGMMDGIANNTAARRSASALATDPTAVMLRTRGVYYDVLHHYLLPQMFVPPTWRTHQAVYYSPVSLNGGLTSVCHHPRVRPNFCEDLWVNFRRSCIDSDAECQATGVVAIDMMRRYRELQATYPDWQIDLTIMSSQEDAQVYAGGVSFLNKRDVDTSTIMRALRCPPEVAEALPFRPEQCETMYVEDYRYEGGVATIGAPNWFPIVAPLRIIAQGYFYVRLLTLVIACYWTRSSEDKYCRAPFHHKLRAAFLTFARVPSQCIIYGSPFPIVCYVIAHVIDAPWTYQIVATKFTTFDGIFSITISEFAVIAAVQMRNIWLLALALQLIIYVATRRSWQAAQGVLGAPEFSFSFFSGITVWSQFRSLAFRHTPIETIFRIQPGGGRDPVGPCIFNSNTNGNMLLEGVMIDFKMMSCLIILASVFVGVLHWVGTKFIRHYHRIVTYLSPRTAVPYSGGTLWSTVALCVCWEAVLLPHVPGNARLAAQHNNYRVQPSNVRVTARPRAWHLRIGSPIIKGQSFRALQRHFARIHERSDEAHAAVAMMNLAMMSDPCTFVSLKLFGGHQICVFGCERTNKVFMLPLTTVLSRQTVDLPWQKMSLLQIINTTDMSWSDLIHCG